MGTGLIADDMLGYSTLENVLELIPATCAVQK